MDQSCNLRNRMMVLLSRMRIAHSRYPVRSCVIERDIRTMAA
jgi:hypothetical protein